MAITASICVIDHEDDPSADVTAMDDGRQFISLRFGSYATVMLPGFDAVSAEYARATAAALTKAAVLCDALAVTAATPAIQTSDVVSATLDEEIF